MNEITVTLTKEEAQHILNSLDLNVRQNGLASAPLSLTVVAKFQEAGKAQQPENKDPA